MKCLLAIAALVASCSLSALARADAPPPAMDCRPVQQELAEAQRRLEEREAACTALEGERARCASDLERSRQREEDRAHDAEVCSAAKERLCGGVGRLAASIADGSVDAGGANACVPQEARARIQARLDGAANTTHALAQLTAYALGETDALPQLGTGKGTPAERSLARIVGRGAGPTRLYRRLLVEAIREAAPQASRDIMRLGPADLDGVFRRGRALDARLQDEVERRASDRGADGASLVRALNLVHAFRILACHDRPAPEACAFAESFAELLESRGDFVVRRRVEEIWETPCASIGVEAVAAWLSDLPAASDVDAADDRELVEAVADKAFVCFLDAATDVTFSDWLRARTPKDAGSAAARARLDALGDRTIDADENACAAAVRALQQLPTPTSCGIDGARRAALAAYVGVGRRAHEPGAPNGLRACDSLVRHLFAGEAATIPPTFEGGPPAHGWVRVDATKPPTRMARVRAACAERRGPEASFDDDVVALAEIAAGLGEVPSAAPWHVVDAGTGADARGTTIEEARFAENRGFSSFAADVLARRSACAALAMRPERCLACSGLPRGEYQDCAVLARLERVRRRFMIESIGASVLAALAALSLVWAGRYRRARRALGSFVTDTVGHLERMGMRARPTRPAWLAPSSMGQIQATLPATAAWERWGDRAVLVRGGMGRRVSEHDVHRAGTVARAEGACVAILVHDDGANPDLGAVRAMLDWAARGSAKAVQILPLSLERLRWSTSADDLLDLVEEASVGGNPFEVRERITSSAQFFARERLVSGLLASAQAGRWVVVTGLRRFGKSSLTLEVARRLPGPHGYVDLAGFHHEIALARDPEAAANAVLRHVCSQLSVSAQAKFPGPGCPEPPQEGRRVDGATVSAFVRALNGWVAARNGGRHFAALVILDEVEQAIGVGPDRLGHALDVLGIVLGRLRQALGEDARSSQARVGVVIASALHPVLWAPLDVLAHQSIMGAFDAVNVPALPREDASAMMRALGARRGIRFTDAALEHLVAESQGVPLMLRRFGSAVLELYDEERARQGVLGALEIGIEGAVAATQREQQPGAALRGWIESDIAPANTPAGVLLRHLASSPACPTAELRALARRCILQQFDLTGVARRLTAAECRRRADEASAIFVALLGSSGLLAAEGDPLEPDAYELPAGALRRALDQPASAIDAA